MMETRLLNIFLNVHQKSHMALSQQIMWLDNWLRKVKIPDSEMCLFPQKWQFYSLEHIGFANFFFFFFLQKLNLQFGFKHPSVNQNFWPNALHVILNFWILCKVAQWILRSRDCEDHARTLPFFPCKNRKVNFRLVL